MTFGFYLAIVVALGVIFGAVIWPRILKQKKAREEREAKEAEERKKAAVEAPAKVKKTLRVLQRDGSYETVEVEE